MNCCVRCSFAHPMVGYHRCRKPWVVADGRKVPLRTVYTVSSCRDSCGFCSHYLSSCAAVTPAGHDLYYYEVIECGRRILLTGVLIFIAPHPAAQAAAACIFAFVSVLGFELLRPHLDPTDTWLYRLVRITALLSRLNRSNLF